MAINFIYSKDSDEIRIMHTKSDNVEIMTGSETDEIIEEVFKSLLQRYQEGLQESMKRSEFIFDSVDALYYDFNKISLNRGGSYIDSPEWLRNKKAAINSKNNDDKCFQYALTAALYYEHIKKKILQEYQKLSLLLISIIGKRDFPSRRKDWKKFEPNKKSIAPNILNVPHNTKEIRHAYKSKYNLNHKNQEILLVITDGEKWHYLAVKSLSTLFRVIISNLKEDLYCLNCFYSYRTENNSKKHKKVSENHDYCYVEMPKKDNKTLKYNHGEKSMKALFIISVDLESLLEKMSTYHSNPEKSSTTEINKHTASGYSLFTHFI